MAQTQSTESERTANLRDVQSARAGKTTRLNLTPLNGEYPTKEEEIVKKEIIRVLGNDRRLAFVGDGGARFLMSMGLLVSNPSDRAQVFAMCLPFTIMGRVQR